MILDRFRMTDKVAIVTGAGRGIGAAAPWAWPRPAPTWSFRPDEDQLAAVAARSRRPGRRAVVVQADLNDLEAVAGLVEQARQEFGRLDIVVNNVGGTMPRPFLDTSPGLLEQAFHFNVATAHPCCGPAVPLMLEGMAARRSTSPRPWAGSRPAASPPTAPPRGRWPTTPAWPPPTWAPRSGSTPSPWGRWPPRRWTSS